MSLLKLFTISSSKVYPEELHPIEGCTTEDEPIASIGPGSYSGKLLHGKRHGHGKYLERNVEYIGEWYEDNIHGEGCIRNTVNQTSFTGIFVMNMMVYGTHMWSNGSMYVGEFDNNQMHGQGTLEWSTREKYEGEFANGTMHGKGTYIDKNGIVYNIEFCKGKVIKQEHKT